MISSQPTEINGSSLLSKAVPVSKETQPQSLSLQYVVLKTLFFATIATVGLIGNGLVLATVVRLRKIRAPCDLLVANICTADLGVSVFSAPLRIFEVYYGLVIGEAMCFILVPLQDVFSSVSVVTHTVIAVYQYRAVTSPFDAKTREKKVKWCLVVIWITCYLTTGASIAFFLSYNPLRGCQVVFTSGTHRIGYKMFLVVSIIILPLFIQCAAYLGVIHKLRAKNAFQLSHTLPDRISDKRLQQNKRLVKILMVMVLAFNLCYLPRGVIMVVTEFAPQASSSVGFGYVNLITLAMFYIKSIINPFILIARSKRFRSNLQVFRCQLFSLALKKIAGI